MEMFLTIVTIGASVLQIILFFKVWGMTNDVKKIANKLCGDECEDEVGGKVKRLSDGKTLIIAKVEDGKYSCIDGATHKLEGVYNKDEIAPVK